MPSSNRGGGEPTRPLGLCQLLWQVAEGKVPMVRGPHGVCPGRQTIPALAAPFAGADCNRVPATQLPAFKDLARGVLCRVLPRADRVRWGLGLERPALLQNAGRELARTSQSDLSLRPGEGRQPGQSPTCLSPPTPNRSDLAGSIIAQPSMDFLSSRRRPLGS